MGLATDYCVQYSVLDAIELGYAVTVVRGRLPRRSTCARATVDCAWDRDARGRRGGRARAPTILATAAERRGDVRLGVPRLHPRRRDRRRARRAGRVPLRGARSAQRFGQSGVDDFEPWDGRPKGALDRRHADDARDRGRACCARCRASARRSATCDPTELVWERYLEWRATQEYAARAARARERPASTALAVGRDGHRRRPDQRQQGRRRHHARRARRASRTCPSARSSCGAEFAAITHGHPTGWLAAGFFADVRRARRARHGAAAGDRATRASCCSRWEDIDETLEAVDLAVELFIADETIDEGIERIGEGWIGRGGARHRAVLRAQLPRGLRGGHARRGRTTAATATRPVASPARCSARALGVESIPGSWVVQVEDGTGSAQLADDLYDGVRRGRGARPAALPAGVRRRR